MTDTSKHMWDQVEKARADGTFSSPEVRSSPESGPDVFTTYNDLPESVRSHLQELEMFIGECDGQWTALQTSDANVVLDNGTIDASDAVKAFNGIVAAFRGLAQSPGLFNVLDINDQDMRELLSAKDVGKGRAILKRILALSDRSGRAVVSNSSTDRTSK